MKQRIALLAMAISFAFLPACGKSSATSGAKVSLNVTSVEPARDDFRGIAWDFLRAVGDSGSSTLAQLKKLKYIFGAVSICESLETNGSGFSNAANCIQIYQGPVLGDGSSGAVTPANLSTFAAHQIDLMDATSRARLNGSTTLTEEHARSYNWAVVNWYTPIAVEASISVGGGVTLNTKAATSYSVTKVALTTADLTAAGSEETVVVSANGGSFFHFQSPFTITPQDITDGSTYVIDMAFNPIGVVSGSKAVPTEPGFSGQLYSSTSQDAMYVPMLQLTPVPRKSTEVSKKETYEIDLGSNGTGRLELYYRDAEKTITGVNLFTVITATDDGSFVQTDNGTKIVEVSKVGGTISLLDNNSPQYTIVSGLTREASGTVQVSWLGGTSATPAARTYTYIDTTEVH